VRWYVAGDIKSGSGEEGPEDRRKPKIEYAVQLGIYTDILERKGWSADRQPFIWELPRRSPADRLAGGGGPASRATATS
jgi:hypothetical protein